MPDDPGAKRTPRAASTDERLRLVIDAVRDYAIFVLDPNGNVATWNTGAALIKGFTADEIIGRHFSTFYTPEAVARGWPEHELAVAALEGRFEDEGWRVRKDGTRFWANVIITALRDESDTLLGFAKVTRDLTERRRHDEQIRRSDERFRLMVESVKDYAIFMLDPTGHVATWNVGAEHIKGYTANEIIGQHFSKFYPPDALQRGLPALELREAERDGRYEDEGWRVRKDGSRFWANVVLTALRDDAGNLRGFAKVTRDLTQRRQVEALEESGRRITEFLAMLAHELRNPLAPIRNAVSVLRTPGIGRPHIERVRDVIDRQVTHLAHLVDDLLDVSRITTGKITLRCDLLDFADVVTGAIDTVRPVIDSRRQQVVVRPADVPLFVNGDLTRLSQVVVNLLNNASKYTPEGKRIWVTWAEEGDRVSLVVRDEGIGIAADLLPKVFDLFAQGERTLARSEGGLGIGLTVVRRLVEMHDGEVRAESFGLNAGSQFTVRLPLAHNVPTITADVPQTQQRTATAHRVLVVDDNTDSADSMAMLLQLTGHITRTAYDGPQAVAIAQEFQPDVVLLDLGLPGMSGFEVAAGLRALPGLAKLALIAMTGYGQPEDKQRTAEAGFAQHLVKPVDPAALEKAVAQAVRPQHA